MKDPDCRSYLLGHQKWRCDQAVVAPLKVRELECSIRRTQTLKKLVLFQKGKRVLWLAPITATIRKTRDILRKTMRRIFFLAFEKTALLLATKYPAIEPTELSMYMRNTIVVEKCS